MRFGIREFGMGAVANALSLDKTGMIPYCATFTIFTDYMRGAIRIAALSQAGTIFVTTHDSIAVGEDGPTHQPIETIPSLRLIPDLTVMRPADGNETAGAYKYAVERSKNESRPTMMAFSRQAVPNLPNSSIENTLKGLKLSEASALLAFSEAQFFDGSRWILRNMDEHRVFIVSSSSLQVP
eukprot:s5871_g3.t1